ncbi:MAG: hypothetical protein COU68_04055 [Candidatus Pacebacteria bacterium CG10_big_fil_rev_8_21_14_0_10_45_6]|nr:MAG: hypothetical protein COU68_04055 [Candidatus Pacebacteria bacterium CG10_big_fil_rev_8_21_14_0_10_45_6]
MSWLICGAVASLAGFFGFFYWWLWVFLLLPFGLLVIFAWRVKKVVLRVPRFEKIVFILLCLVWLLHLLQVFVPETGFDALWYHLPLAELLQEQHGYTYLPELYQSANPQFADSIFALGFGFAQSLGTKLVAYGFALSLVAITYQLSRIFLSRRWSFVAVLSVSLFQVVAWQSASFYIDVAKACFELAGLWLLQEGFSAKNEYAKKYFLLSALSFAASLASKAFSILLLPVLVYFYARTTKRKIRLLLFVVLVLLALPFYLFAQSHTGSFFFSTQVQVNQLSAFEYIARQLQRFPFIFMNLFFTRDYTFPLLGLLPFAIYFLRRQIWKSQRLQILALFTANQLAIWWFVPPLSTRYALAGFISGLLLVLVWLSKRTEPFWIHVIFAISILFLVPRLFVAKRSLTYLIGKQTQEQYVEQFKDGNNTWVLDAWYGKK